MKAKAERLESETREIPQWCGCADWKEAYWWGCLHCYDEMRFCMFCGSRLVKHDTDEDKEAATQRAGSGSASDGC